MRFDATIGAFAAALLDPTAPAPAATRGRLDAPDARRFSVYRNNVAAGLIGAIDARYPVSRWIVGDDAFRAVARAYARASKPHSPVMIDYGRDFPDFAAAFLAAEGLADGAMIADVARLENAWVDAYHAEDATPATVSDLGGLGPDALSGTRVIFHPAARLLRFSTPAASIWAAHQGDAGAAKPGLSTSEDALITRPDLEVSVRVLRPLAYDFALSLRSGATLIEATLAANSPEFDFGTHLVGLVESGAVASFI